MDTNNVLVDVAAGLSTGSLFCGITVFLVGLFLRKLGIMTTGFIIFFMGTSVSWAHSMNTHTGNATAIMVMLIVSLLVYIVGSFWTQYSLEKSKVAETARQNASK